MKKISTFLLLVIFTLILCSCTQNPDVPSSSGTIATQNEDILPSSDTNATQNSRTLLLAMTASDDLNNIGGIRIVTSSCTTGAPVISDKSDMKFLQDYTYSHSATTKKGLESQLLQNKTKYSFEVVTQSQSKHFLYLMQDGSIAIKTMCGDSEVQDVSYDFYTATEKNILTEEKIKSILNEDAQTK